MDLSRLKTTRSIANLRAGRNDWYRVVKAQAPDLPTQVMVYDEIGWFGITAQDFINEMKDVSGPVDLHLNSPGGEVFDGLAIYQYLAGRGDVTTYVDSLAASIASVIAMAGNEIVIGKNASLMIHDGFGVCIGNAADMRTEADLLDRVSDNIADVYAGRTGKPKDHWREQMLAETWYFGQEAVDAGLADRIAPAPMKQAPAEDNSARQAMAAHFDLSVFRNTPDRLKAKSGAGDNPTEIKLNWTASGEDFAATLRRNIQARNQTVKPDAAQAKADAVATLVAAGYEADRVLAVLDGTDADPPGETPPPTPPQPTPEAPAETDRGFSVPAGGAMDGIPRDEFREWLNQGLKLVGEHGSEAPVSDSAAVQNATMHEPHDGTHTHAHPAFGAQGDDDTHEHEHSHSGDADHGHGHGDDDGDESDADGGMQNNSAHRVLGIESMPLANKAQTIHHTATVDEPWDGPAAVAAMPNDDKVLRYCHAWMSDEAAAEKSEEGDDDADDKKGNYRFPHHKTEGGPANIPACHNGLSRLDGSKIPDGDKPGVKAHLQAHIDDANKSDDDSGGTSNHTHESPGDAWSWDPDAFRKAMEGAYTQ